MEFILEANPFNITIYTFLLIVLASLLLLFIVGDTKDKAYQKIIGGITVFVVALISQKWQVIFISLFIGGLIIASEKFLQSLAAILRTDGSAIPDTIAALNNSVSVTIASEEEVGKQEREENSVNKTNDQNRLSVEQINTVEQKIIDILSERYSTHFTPNLKLENQYGQIVIDGAVHYSADLGKLTLDNVLGLAEIKYISRPESNFSFEFSVKRVLERIRYLFISKQILIIFYAKDISKERAEEISIRLRSLYSQKSGEGDVTFGFINLQEDLHIEVISLPDLKSHVL